MKNQPSAEWNRLEKVIKETHHTTNSFAKHIGLLRGENLYQIKRGNNRISLDVAQRIHEHYPEYSIAWLLCGEGDENLNLRNNPVVCVPLCRNLWTIDFSQLDKLNDKIIVSESVANGAQLAVPYSDGMLEPYLRNSILLIRKCENDEIIFGNIYLIMMGATRIFRIIRENAHNPHTLRLAGLNPERFDDMIIRREQIGSLGLVCGAISQMVQ